MPSLCYFTIDETPNLHSGQPPHWPEIGEQSYTIGDDEKDLTIIFTFEETPATPAQRPPTPAQRPPSTRKAAIAARQKLKDYPHNISNLKSFQVAQRKRALSGWQTLYHEPQPIILRQIVNDEGHTRPRYCARLTVSLLNDLARREVRRYPGTLYFIIRARIECEAIHGGYYMECGFKGISAYPGNPYSR